MTCVHARLYYVVMRLPAPLHRCVTACVLIALSFMVLWRGGKSLDAVWMLGGIGVALGLMSVVIPRQRQPFSSSPIMQRVACAALWAYVGWTVISFVFSSARTYGLDEVVQAMALALVVTWVIRHPWDDRRFALALGRALSASLLIACAAGMLVYLYQPVTRFVGTFFDARFHTDYWPNAWAEFIVMTWPLLLLVLLQTRQGNFLRRRRHDALRLVVLGFVGGCLLLSYSRGALLAFGGQVILLCALALWSRRGVLPWKSILVSVSFIAVVSTLTFVAMNAARSQRFDIESVTAKATLTASEGASSVSERHQFFTQAFSLSLMRPIVGWGPYSFRFVQPHAQSGILATSDHPHNVLLKIMMERGFPALVFFLVFLTIVMIVVMRRMADSRTSSVDAPWDHRLFLVVSVLGVFAHCLIDFNLQFVAIALPLWMMLGLLLRSGVAMPMPHVAERMVIGIVAALLLALLSFEGIMLWRSSIARHADVDGQPLLALQAYEGTNHSFFSRDGWLSRSMLLLGMGRFADAENAIRIALAESPFDARAWRILGDVYRAWGKRPEALRSYEKAYDEGKWNDAGIIRGLVSVLQMDREQLVSRRAEFDRMLAAYVDAIATNVHFIALGQNVESAIALAHDMALLFPDERDRYHFAIQRMRDAADRERARLLSRPRGLLW